MKHLTLAALLLVAASACQKKEEPTEPIETTVAPAMESAAPAVEEPEPSAEDLDIPTPEDFEEEAIEDITADNMEEELDRLEAEIGG